MPAIITHHIFGEDITRDLPGGLVEGDEELLAFLLGNQGPDPLFARFRTTPARAARAARLAHDLHHAPAAPTLRALRDGVTHLPAADARVGRAWALGFLGHFALDSVAHPFVIGQQRALCAADPGLARAAREVHAVIESDIDSWILWEKRRSTVEESPVADNLMRTARVERVAGALVSQMALAALGSELAPHEYGAAVRDYELICRVIEPAGAPRVRRLGAVERLLRGRSAAEAHAHYVRRSPDCPAANLDGRAWDDPFDGAVRTESFADLFDEARLRYPALAEAFVRGDADGLDRLAGGRNFQGERVA
ncbi:zinc dependent phospholipase C family protein [Thermophilibacter sp.]